MSYRSPFETVGSDSGSSQTTAGVKLAESSVPFGERCGELSMEGKIVASPCGVLLSRNRAQHDVCETDLLATHGVTMSANIGQNTLHRL